MAEEGSVYELEALEEQLHTLSQRYSSEDLRADSKSFCADFCKLVEEYASRWQVPLPQLRILEISLVYFTRASTFFKSNCDHVLRTLSSLALSVFELLLFFDQEDFHQETLKHFIATFQECNLAVERHQNVHLLQVARLLRGGGPWVSLVLQEILSESILPQNEVDGFISSELPVFLELRVRYLLSSARVSEAMALAKCCARHPTTGQHTFFLQFYLMWLHKTSHHDRLHKEVADINGKSAVNIICSLEYEEEDDLLLALCRAFLSCQLRRGDMYYLCDLVFIWSKLHSKLKTSKQSLLEESHLLMLSATNVNSIFPFIRAILQVLGEDGIQFCVELCASTLESCPSCDVGTKSLVYKTIAGLLPNDLEVCRACALLVFFLERTFEAYKVVYLLYMHPDQEYHAEYSPIGNHVRFETLQVLKKDLYFDPEFWNLIALRTNCLKLMNEKVVSAALEEIMEDKWISSYCTKVPASRSSTLSCHKGNKAALPQAANKRHHKEGADTASKKLKVSPGKKEKSKKVTQTLRDTSSKPMRRSFWQLERLQDNVTVAYGEHRRITRLSEKNPPKRRIRKPRWLMEDSGALDVNNVLPKIKKHGLKHEKHLRSSILKRADHVRASVKYKPSVNSCLKANEIKQRRGYPLECPDTPPPQVILELSLPDNELMGTFPEDTCNRQRGLPQVLLYKPTVKLPSSSQPVKTGHGKEVVLRARDEAMFVLQMHCYARQQKGKGKGLNIQGSVSTITRSSVQGSPPKESPRELCENSEIKDSIASQTQVPAGNLETSPQTTRAVSRKTSTRECSEKFVAKMTCTTASKTTAANDVAETPLLDKVLQAQPRALVEELCEEPTVEMKVTIASQTSTQAKGTQSSDLEKVSEGPGVGPILEDTVSSEVSRSTAEDDNQVEVSIMANMSNIATSGPVSSQFIDVSQKEGDQDFSLERNVVTSTKASETRAASAVINQDSIKDLSCLTLVTEVVAELSPEDLEIDKQQVPENSSSMESTAGNKPNVAQQISSKSSCSIPSDDASTVADDEGKKGKSTMQDIVSKTSENSDPVEMLPESEESKLEYCCTFCNKVFKGSRVIAHAMFHCRKDECMFCGADFKNDLLAMMHLSNHIEKLKRVKESVGKPCHENSLSLVSETKDFSTPRTSAKTKTTHVSSSRSSGRLKKTDRAKSESLPDSKPSEFRRLRSNASKVDGQLLQQRKQNALEHLNGETHVHNVNGHIGKKQELHRVKKNLEAKQPQTRQKTPHRKHNDSFKLLENHDIEMDSTTSPAPIEKHFGCSRKSITREKESRQLPKKASKQDGKEPQEKVCCSVDGCAWFTDLSKSRVALLYHALEDHYGEAKPLELAFQVENGKCSICMRVLWSFEHFLHHVERHRLSPRHPCPHQGCTARFKTGMEMRRHARKHSPLQAVCCLPGCSKLFICLWALNLHEREHYASKDTKSDKNSNMQTGDKQSNTQSGKKQQDKSNDATATTAVNETESVKAAPRLQATHNISSGKPDRAASLSPARASRLKQRLKDKSETKDLNILKNLSNKDASAQPTVSYLRARQTLAKRKETHTSLKTAKSHRIFSSSFLKQSQLKHKFRRKLVKINSKSCKRRGRPPKSNMAVHDENNTSPETIHKDQRSPPLTSNPKPAEISTNLSNESIEKKIGQVAEDEAPMDESNLKKPVDKQIEDDVKHKDNTTTAVVTASILSQTKKKLHEVKKLSYSQTVSVDSNKSKKRKAINIKTNTKKVKKNCSSKEPVSVLQNSAKYKSTVEAEAPEAVGKISEVGEEEQVENTDSTQDKSENPAPVTIADSVDENMAPPTSSSENTHSLTIEVNSTGSHTTGKEEKKAKNRRPACSGGAEKKCEKGNRRTVNEKWPRKASKTSAAKKRKTKPEVQEQVEAKTILVNTVYGNVETSDLTIKKSVNGKAKSTATADQRQRNKSKKDTVKTVSDPKKANQKRKKMNRESVKKAGPDQLLSEGKGAVEAPEKGTLQPTFGSPGSSLAMNGLTANEDVKKPSGPLDILAKYSKRPYMRLPPTAYLDEKYITMPKRRKEISFFPWSQIDSTPEQTSSTTTLQRQRCANCFATFNSAEELQSHLQLQNCSTLFGFDSDDEGNG